MLGPSRPSSTFPSRLECAIDRTYGHLAPDADYERDLLDAFDAKNERLGSYRLRN